MSTTDRWSVPKAEDDEPNRSRDIVGTRRRQARIDIIYSNGFSELFAWFHLGPVLFSQPGPSSGVMSAIIPAPGVKIHLAGEHLEKLKREFQEEKAYRLEPGPHESGAVIGSIVREEVKK